MALWGLGLHPLLLPVVTTVVLLFFWLQSRNKWKLFEKLPGPKGLPIIGNLAEFASKRTDALRVLLRLCEEHNGFFKLWIGWTPMIVVTEPEHLQVFYTNTSMLDRSQVYHSLRDIVGDNLFLSDGGKWKHFRKLFMANFNTTSPELLTMNFVECSKIMMSELERHADGPFFAIKSTLHMHTANSILLAAIGEKVPRVNTEELLEGAENVLEIAYNRNFQPLLHFDVFFNCTQISRKLNNIRNFAYKCLNEIVQRKKIEMEEFKNRNESIPNLYIYKMLEQESMTIVSTELENLILAGLDTTSDTIGFTLLCLGLFPDVQQKVLEEDEQFQKLSSGRAPDSNDLEHYEYLERVIKESLRIFPVGPAIARRLGKDTRFGEYLVPKGVDVTALPIYTNRNPKYFTNPLKFDPDRFLPENMKHLPPYVFNPFSSGPRGCPGKKYAYLLMKIYIPAIVRKYKITSQYESLEEAIRNAEAKFTLRDNNGYQIRLESRF